MSDSPLITGWRPTIERYDTHIPNAWVEHNRFLVEAPEQADLPAYAGSAEILPHPFWSGHQSTIDCYWRAWELVFTNLKRPTPENGFVSNFCDTAFNGNLFMWDSAFISGFGLYGRRVFNFQKTLDNFYRKQHRDGFICREIAETDGSDTFHRFDPSSTGPNVLAWVEWRHYLATGDRQRLEMVFEPLVAYHQWMRKYRTWNDGSYWTTGWGCGMDNLPRSADESPLDWDNGHLTWIDATLQALLSAKTLLQMADVLGESEHLADMRDEVEGLSDYVNRKLWNEDTQFYSDRLANGRLSPVKHIGAFWALLAGCAGEKYLPALIAHLENPAEFNRIHRVPSLSADDPRYSGGGAYWRGGIWAPTNYMVLKGLEAVGRKDLAFEIGMNHNQNVAQVFEMENTPWKGAEQFRNFFHLTDLQFDDHHTLWENYAPDEVAPGEHSKPGYVGWTGLPPIAVLFENIFGLNPDASTGRLAWDVRLIEGHGVSQYPFGLSGLLDLKCAARQSAHERPVLSIHSNVPFTLDLTWNGGKESIKVD
jgi:hypothetical protein